MQDEYYMARALKLAQRGRFTRIPTRMSGASLSKMAKLSVKVAHQRAGEPHAEVHALRMAGEKPKAQRRISHSNPVAIMVVRHRVVMH